MERKLALRDASPEDIEAILAVQRASPGAGPWDPTDYSSALDDDSTVCLLAADPIRDRLAAFLLARIVADEMEILNLAVTPDYRRRGIGCRLVAEALARAQAAGARHCWLEVRASNQPARDFYRALGFAENGRRQGYYRHPEDDAVVCGRALAEAAGPSP